MDIRNIPQSPEVVTSTQLLPKAFSYNDEQLELYRKIEKLPEWPFDVNNPNQQRILKDFIGNVIEELTEGIESLMSIKQILDPVGWNLNRLVDTDLQVIENLLQNANEEQADALGFYLTLFRFSNIDACDILSYKDYLTWEEIFEEGVAMQVRTNLYLSDAMKTRAFHLHQETGIIPGFTYLSNERLEDIKDMVFEVIYHLSIARNLLKSRIWKQTPVMTKELEYQEELVKSFYMYMGFLAFIGFTPQSYYTLFFKKQQLNLWRINSNY